MSWLSRLFKKERTKVPTPAAPLRIKCKDYIRKGLVYHDEAYNLPLDVVYYIESEWNYHLNDYVREHLSELEEMMNHHADSFFPYRLVYVSRQQDAISNILTLLHPELKGVDMPNEKPIDRDLLFAQGDTNKQSNPLFVPSFMVRIMPFEEDNYTFLAIDMERSRSNDLRLSLCDLVYRTARINHTILETGAPTDFSFLEEAPIQSHFTLEDDVVKNSEFAPSDDLYIPKLAQERVRDSGIRFSLRFEEDKPWEDPDAHPIENRLRELIWKQENGGYVDRNKFMSLRTLYIASEAQYKEYKRQHRAERLRKEEEERRRREEEERRREEEERRREEELRRKAIAICESIREMQRSDGLGILSEMMGEQMISLLRAQAGIAGSSCPLVIDSSFHILLPDYDQEIQLGTLPKALYILWLRHPEGLHRDMLDLHRDELRTIYLTLSNRTNTDELMHSIDLLVEPGSTSLNEKISVINKAFREHLASDLAAHYMIAGPRGEAKRVLAAVTATLPDVLRF